MSRLLCFPVVMSLLPGVIALFAGVAPAVPVPPSVAAASSLAVSSLGSAACWGYGWRYEFALESFHSSWTPEECRALQELNRYICRFFDENVGFSPDKEWIEFVCFFRQYGAVLKEIAMTGRADVYTDEGDTPARWAYSSRNMAALRALVEHGCDPVHHFVPRDSVEGYWDGLLPAVMADFRIGGEDPMPSSQRIALLDWMVSKGARISKEETGNYAIFAYLAGLICDKNPDIIEWGVNNGMETGVYRDNRGRRVNMASTIASIPHSLPLLQKLDGEGRLDLMVRDVASLPLQAAMSHPDKEKIAWLLEKGCDPNAVSALPPPIRPEGMDDEEYEDLCFDLKGDSDTPLVKLLLQIQMDLDDPEEVGKKLEILELLLQHGARDLPPYRASSIRKVRHEQWKRVEQMLLKYYITL